MYLFLIDTYSIALVKHKIKENLDKNTIIYTIKVNGRIHPN